MRKANKYLMMMRVLLGWDCRTFFMWTARSWRLSIAGNNTAGTPRRLLRQSNSKDPGGLAEKTLTHTGYEVMEDFFREEGMVQSSKV